MNNIIMGVMGVLMVVFIATFISVSTIMAYDYEHSIVDVNKERECVCCERCKQ